MSQLGLKQNNDGSLDIQDVIARLEAMRPVNEVKEIETLEDFDMSRKDDYMYCVEWGTKKGQWQEQGVLDRYIKELKELL